MRFSQLCRSVRSHLAQHDIKNHAFCYGHTIDEDTTGAVWVDYIKTNHSCLEEAREYIKQQQIHKDIQQEIQQELYEEMSDNKIAAIIKAHHSDVRVTDTLIESYVELASSKIFTTDSVALDIRKVNKLDRVIEGRLDYKLADGAVIVITEDAQDKINNIFGKHPDVIEYMRESKEHFLDVLNQIEE